MGFCDEGVRPQDLLKTPQGGCQPESNGADLRREPSRDVHRCFNIGFATAFQAFAQLGFAHEASI
jgi:hypothetical protein